jgi:UDP-N-acetylmuramoylalanine--D-glutamate ligase
MHLADLSNKLVIILGFGREGRAMFDVLQKENGKWKRENRSCKIIVTDEQIIDVPEFVPLAEAIAAVTSETVVIKAPGIPWHKVYVEEMQHAGAQFTSSTNLFMAERKGRGTIIGITGTKGKSTTSSLLAHVFQAAGKRVVLAGNIGEPSISHLDEPADTIFVLEMSSYQLSDLTIAPDIAMIINLFEEHMDYHGDVASYHAAKARIAELQTASDVFVYNEKFPMLVQLASRVSSLTLPFVDRLDPSLTVLTLLGDHNRENAAGVLAVTDHFGIDRAVVESAFASFKALPHRLQEIGSVNGIRFINDSISTTPQSALAAIDVYQDSLGAIILGGQDRGYDFSALAKRVVELGVRCYILQNGEHLAEAIRSKGGSPIMMSNFSEIIHDVLTHYTLHPTPSSLLTCLLSPASPSYGQFKNFEDRGNQFIVAVQSAA